MACAELLCCERGYHGPGGPGGPPGAALDEPGPVRGGFMAVTSGFVHHGVRRSRPVQRRCMLPEGIIRRLPSAHDLRGTPLGPGVLETRPPGGWLVAGYIGTLRGVSRVRLPRPRGDPRGPGAVDAAMTSHWLHALRSTPLEYTVKVPHSNSATVRHLGGCSALRRLLGARAFADSYGWFKVDHRS